MNGFQRLLDYELQNDIDVVQHKIYNYIDNPKNKNGEITDDDILSRTKTDFKIGRPRVFKALKIMKERGLIIQDKRLHRKKNKQPRMHTFNRINKKHAYFEIHEAFENWKKTNRIKEDKNLEQSYNLVWAYNHTLQLLAKLKENDKVKKEMNYVEIILKLVKNLDSMKQTATLDQLITDLNQLKRYHLENLRLHTNGLFQKLPDPIF